MSLANWSDIIEICKDGFPKQPLIKEQKFPRSIIIKRQRMDLEFPIVKVKGK